MEVPEPSCRILDVNLRTPKRRSPYEEIQIGGEPENIEGSFRNLILSIAVALALVYLILVIFFGLLVPLIILLAVPLTTVGPFEAFLLTNTALSVPALLGVLL